MLKFENVTFKYTKDSPEVLENFNAEFPTNKISVIMSSNGLGKTTVLKLAARRLSPNKGRIANSNRMISYVFQEDRLMDELTVLDNLRMITESKKPGYQKLSKHDSIQAITKMLKLLGIEQCINYYPAQLSGSMKKRVAIARAFLHPSELLLMDEPFNNLDIQLKSEIMKIFIKLWEQDKRTVLFVTHSADEALTLGNKIYFLGNKPMRVMKTLNIKGSNQNRDISSEQMIKYRKTILNFFFDRVKEEHK